MKRISILVLVLIVFVWAQQSKPQASNSRVPTSFIVVDSTGKTIGSVIGVGETHSTVVAVAFQGSFLPVTVFRTSFLTDTLFSTSSDCTGQPYQDESNSPFPASAVSGPGSMLFAASGPSQSITAASTLVGGGNCFPTGFPISDAVPMAPVMNLNVFTPPFKVLSKLRED